MMSIHFNRQQWPGNRSWIKIQCKQCCEPISGHIRYWQCTQDFRRKMAAGAWDLVVLFLFQLIFCNLGLYYSHLSIKKYTQWKPWKSYNLEVVWYYCFPGIFPVLSNFYKFLVYFQVLEKHYGYPGYFPFYWRCGNPDVRSILIQWQNTVN